MSVRYFDRAGNQISREESYEYYREGGDDKRRVGSFQIGDLLVSTVHLVLDHQYAPEGPPLIFETMVFGDANDEPCWRYSTEEQAQLGHFSVCDQLKAGIPLAEVDPFDPRYGRGHG